MPSEFPLHQVNLSLSVVSLISAKTPHWSFSHAHLTQLLGRPALFIPAFMDEVQVETWKGTSSGVRPDQGEIDECIVGESDRDRKPLTLYEV